MPKFDICIASDVPAYQSREVEAESLEEALKQLADIANNELSEVEWDLADNWRVVSIKDESGEHHYEGCPIVWEGPHGETARVVIGEGG